MRYRVALAMLYLSLLTLWIYGVLDRQAEPATTWFLLWLLAQFAIGLVISRWWAIVLPVLVVLIAVPAGYPPITPENYEPFPIWFSAAVGALFAIPLAVLGVAVRKIYDRRTEPRSPGLTS